MNLNNIDLNKLSVFSRIVDAGNYRLAAEVLNVTPSALSQTISSLEFHLGIPLFHRLGKKLILTSEGERIHREFKKHQEDFHRSLLEISKGSESVNGLLRIGAYFEFAKFRLSPIVSSFQKKYPDIQIKFVFDTPSRLHRMLSENKLDLGFSIYPEQESPLILSKPIYKEELVLVAPHGLLPEKVTFEDIIQSPMIEYYFNHQPIRRWLFFHYRKKPKQLPIRTFGATAEMVLALIQEGLGIGIVPEYLLQKKTDKNWTVIRPTHRKLADHIWMLQLKKGNNNKALEAFTSEVEKVLTRVSKHPPK